MNRDDKQALGSDLSGGLGREYGTSFECYLPEDRLSEAPRYTIKTLEDMSQVPTDRIDAFLEDLRHCLLLQRAGENLQDAFIRGIDPRLEAKFILREMEWIDDGMHNCPSFQVEGEHLASIPENRIDAVVDGMNHHAEILRNRK